MPPHLFIADFRVEVIVGEERTIRGLKGSADRVAAGALMVQAAVGDIAHGVDLRRAAELDDVESESSAYCRAANGALGRSVHRAK